MINSSIKTYKYVISALFAAFIAITSQFAVYIGMVPISLSLVAVYLAGMILGARYGVVSVIVYILLGAAGIPVFAGGKGGIAVIFGPTGGFITGYIGCVLIVGLVADRMYKKKIYYIIGMMSGIMLCYIMGTVWYRIISGVSISTALKYCVIPFIPGDIVKIAVTMFVFDIMKKRMPSVFINR